MVGYTYTSIPLDFSPLSEMRNLKIRMVTEDIKFEVADNLIDLYSNWMFTGKQKHNLDLFVIFKHFNCGL